MNMISKRQILPFLLLALFASAAFAETPSTSPQDRKVVREGIAIELEMEPIDAQVKARGELREGDTVNFRFHVTDTNTKTPLSGVYPAAWMDRRLKGEAVTGPQACQDKVEAFIGGSLFTPPELDLNVYYVLALNDDATISVVDPLFGFGTTKLLDMIFLKSPGEDWILTEDQMTLFVSLPQDNEVAVASTATWEVVRNVKVGTRPSRLALQGDEQYLWVAYDAMRYGTSGVTVLDAKTFEVKKDILTGTGDHEIAFSAGDRYAFVTNSDDGTLSVIDVARLEKVKDVPVGRDPVSLAYSPAADAVYVTHRSDGTIVAVDGTSHEEIARLRTRSGLEQIRFAPDGKLAFAVNPATDEVLILDAATNRVVQTADVEAGPDQVAFSDHLAYVRHQGSETVLMIPLDQVGREGARVPLIDFPGGQRPFGEGRRPSAASSIVQAPGATAVLVANPADETIYFYKEGMAAPMGNFQNYRRQPRAVLAVDRSLEERTPGSYETVATLRTPGVYDLAFFLDSPRTIHCFEVEVRPSPELEAKRDRERPIQVQPIFDGEELRHGQRVNLKVGEHVALKFRLLDSVTRKPRGGLPDVTVLTYRASGRNQLRQTARQVGDGLYEVDFLPENAGVYYAFVECDSAGLRYNQSTQVILLARDESTVAAEQATR